MKGRRARGIWREKSQMSAIASTDSYQFCVKVGNVCYVPRYCTFSSPINANGPACWRLPARCRARKAL